MKFIKSNFAKRLIIILVALMIFNIAIPQEVNAGILDGVVEAAGGILFIPLKMLILTSTANINIQLGLFLNGGTGTVKNILDQINNSNSFGDAIANGVSEIFVGPEDIFSGDIDILNANLFEKLESGTVGEFINNVVSGSDRSGIRQ